MKPPRNGPRVKPPPKEEPIVEHKYHYSGESHSLLLIAVCAWSVLLTIVFAVHIIFHPDPQPQPTVPPVQKRHSTMFNLSATSPKLMELPMSLSNVIHYTVCCRDADSIGCDHGSGLSIKLIHPDVIRVLVREARAARCEIEWKLSQ